ncbi:hypothetical protein B5X24_HaOG214161, partial [Helicoverpa armigera]
DLAVLRFGVYDENGKLLGQRILPLDGLQAGYRHISLRTEANFPMSLPMLFCNIELKIYVPDGFEDFMAALSDPRAFMGAAKERNDKVKQMGIEETGPEKKVQIEEKKEGIGGYSLRRSKRPAAVNNAQAFAQTQNALYSLILTRLVGYLRRPEKDHFIYQYLISLLFNSTLTKSLRSSLTPHTKQHYLKYARYRCSASDMLRTRRVHSRSVCARADMSTVSFCLEPPLVFEPITVESLRQEKGFVKTGRKQQKELDAMRKRHAKEKMALQKTQCSALEKMIKGKNKDQLSNDAAFRKLVSEQATAWSELVARQRVEEWTSARSRLNEQRDLLKKMMEATQLAQMKQLEGKHERELKEMNARQAKISMETSKEVANDKTLKTKQEKDRRL